MENTTFIIDEKEREEAKALAQSFVKTDVRSRAYINALGSEVCLKYLRENNILNEKKYKTKMLLQVHDELIFDVPEDELDDIKEMIQNEMENIYKLSVPLKVEINYGKNWYDAK